MGWIGRLFGVYTPAERVDRARRFLAEGQANDARLELEGVEGAEAEALLQQARGLLATWNLEEARAHLSAGDEDGAAEHLELATAFGAAPDALRQVRREARELREAERRAQEAAAQAAETVQAEGDDPLWSLPPSDPRLRFAMLVEAWPAALRERLLALGKDYAAGVMALEDGDPQAAVQALSAFVEAEPAARYDRARAALALGDLGAAANDLVRLGEALGHQVIGGQHTAVLLAQVLARQGRTDEALRRVEAELQRGPDLALAATRAQLLEGLGRLEDAEAATVRVLEQTTSDLGMFRLLGRVRIRRGDRMGAMQALEGSMTACKCGTPGKCGSRPPDLPSLRMLVQLYLEDRLDPARARELLGMLAGMVQEPTWDDAYLAALAARNDGLPQAPDMARALRQGLAPGDPRHRLLDERLPLQLGA